MPLKQINYFTIHIFYYSICTCDEMGAELLSVFLHEDKLIIAEKDEDKHNFVVRQYDSTSRAIDNIPRSRDGTVLPPDSTLLMNYTVSAWNGEYCFEYLVNFVGGYISHYRLPEHEMDIFMVGSKIVHAQEYKPKDKKDEIIDQITDIAKNCSTPDEFEEAIDKVLGEFEDVFVEEINNLNLEFKE